MEQNNCESHKISKSDRSLEIQRYAIKKEIVKRYYIRRLEQKIISNANRTKSNISIK